jgi:hypothetical protein
MINLLAFLLTFFYCYDDHLAELVGQPWVGTVPLWLWLVLWLGTGAV